METDKPARNSRTALLLSLLVAGMFAFAFAVVPLYGLICDIAGIQAATPAAAANVTEQDGGRMVTVKFDATVNDGLPWEFAPNVRSMRVPVGKVQHVSYRAKNLSSQPVAGQAIPAVVPWQATTHFSKTECFCFRRQTLDGGETKEMPLAFLITPDLPEAIDTLTLSYTFMNAGAATAPAWESLDATRKAGS